MYYKEKSFLIDMLEKEEKEKGRRSTMYRSLNSVIRELEKKEREKVKNNNRFSTL